MSDAIDMKMVRLGDLFADEAKSAAPMKPGKGGKGGKSKPPWVDKDSEKPAPDDIDAPVGDDIDEDEDVVPSRRGSKATPQPPKGSFRPSQPKRGSDMRMPKVTTRRRRGAAAEVQPIAWGGKRTEKSARGAGRISTWGPPNQRVDITRARGDGASDQRPHDPRVRRAAQRDDADDFRPRRGSAGGNGVTRGNSGSAIQGNPPDNVGRRRSGGGRRGRQSGAEMATRTPPNVRKSLYDYSPDEVADALDVAVKALNGLRRDLESPDFR